MSVVACSELVYYLNNLLSVHDYCDYCPNGLQVQGRDKIKKIVSGVTANQELIDAAIELNADALLVHHGYFWKGEDPCIVGMKYQRLLSLMSKDINLIAYHLPLDGHKVFGNNAQLAELLHFSVEGQWIVDGMPLVFHGGLNGPLSGEELAANISTSLQREPLYIPGNDQLISTVAWCTGAAQDYIDLAVEHGIDAYITGEVSERTVHVARESGVHFYSAGHHATERYGILSLGEHLAQNFGIEHHFIDINNPV